MASAGGQLATEIGGYTLASHSRSKQPLNGVTRKQAKVKTVMPTANRAIVH
jgi:hypothetical protein